MTAGAGPEGAPPPLQPATAWFSGAARLAGVLGWPVAHSLSPCLHNFWFRRHGIDGVYVPFAVPPGDLATVFAALPKLGLRGWNVTLPHKEEAFRLVGRHDAAAQRMGAVNTVLVGSDAVLEGRNTDGAGFMANLRQAAPRWRPETGPAVLLGCGGAARAVAWMLGEAGVPELRLVNRTADRALALQAELRDRLPLRVEVRAWPSRADLLADATLLVQCTSLGMRGKPALELTLERLPVQAAVCDLVYVPLETELLARARARGNVVVDGLGMLLHQAVPGFAHWGGATPVVDAASRAALLERLAAG